MDGRKAAVQAVDGQPGKKEKKDGWAQRVLTEPRLGLAMLVGALVGIPGASYLTALHILVTGLAVAGSRPVGGWPVPFHPVGVMRLRATRWIVMA